MVDEIRTDMLHNRDGSLNRYALSCGYIEREYTYGETGRMSKSTTLWMEGGVYHVRQHDYVTHERIFWDTFDKLTDARKCYRKAVRNG